MTGEIVIINGIIQARAEYHINANTIVFHNAPQAGSTINILTEDNERLDFHGDGSSCVFAGPASEKAKFRQFMTEVYNKKDDPTVKDQLEKLKIVMELVR